MKITDVHSLGLKKMSCALLYCSAHHTSLTLKSEITKIKHLFWGALTCFRCENKNGVSILRYTYV